MKTFEHNPHGLKTHRDNEQIKAHKVIQTFSKEEMDEYKKCMIDPAYFARRFVKIINLDKGLINFNLYDYQEKMFNVVNDNRFSIVLAPRQSGKTIAFVIYLLWYAIFNPDQTVVILANKGDTARELLARIILALENLPFFLQPGCKALNKGSIEFSNNSKIVARATSNSSVRGLSANLLYLDEFAFVERDEKFYTSTYPVITGGKSTKVIITSTANGVGNMFYKLWRGATQNTNSFKAFEVKWWNVPGRDEKWKEETIANTSERQFAQEFGNEFLGGSNTLISGDVLFSLKAENPVLITSNANVFEKPKENNSYVLTADVSEGVGKDDSAFSIINVSQIPFKQVVSYRNERISPYLFASIIVDFAKVYNNAFVCVESNEYGLITNHSIVNDLEYENVYAQSFVKSGKTGIRTDKKVKRIGCSNFKDLVENGKLQIVDEGTIDQINVFEEKGGSYQGAKGAKDDLVMSLVLFSYLVSTQIFKNEFEMNLKNVIFSPEAIDLFNKSQMPVFGIIKKSNEPQEEVVFEPNKNVRFVKDELFGIAIVETTEEDEFSRYLF